LSIGFQIKGGTVFEHQAAFMETLRAGRQMRTRVFDTLEQRHAHDFGNGTAGIKLYEDLLSAVRDAGVPEAAEEFENRFFPLLKPDRPRGEEDFGAPRDNRPGGSWGWISALCVAAVMLGALILGSNALRMTTAEPPTVTEAPIPAPTATESAETKIEPAPAAAAEQDDPSPER
jgi:hypothetical protein